MPLAPQKPRLQLPVDGLIPELKARLAEHSAVVVQASPGSGKTTRIPPALLRDEGEVLVLEPRRVAAKYAARRVADELGTQVGELVGYQFRFENMTSARTRLRFLTEGMLMRKFLSDPTLRGAHTVILDEFHERHLHGDIALAYLRRLQLTSRPDLKLVVMSATLDSEAISKYLGDAPTLRIDAPLFPVELEYLPSPAAKPLEVLVKDAFSRALSQEKGDILVFLPGMGEIRRCADAVRGLAEQNATFIAPLHGELSREEQELAIEPSSRRKIILATNVAETSLTIQGVRVVIDSGFHRMASYSWWSGVPTLKTRPISRASAIQRAGRAGRTGPGRCIRLYTRGEFEGRAPFQTPEISRADLTQSVLELKSLGILQPKSMNWFEAPPPQALDSSEALLYRLGALSSVGGALSELGRRMIRVPAHPRIARMVLEASQSESALKEASLLGALISEGELESFDALEPVRKGFLPDRVRKLADQIARSVDLMTRARPRPLGYAVLCGFPDRVARKKPGGDLVFSEEGSARCPESPLFQSSDYFVLLDVQERQGLAQARSSVEVKSAAAIEADWLLDLEPSQIEEKEELAWDHDRKRVQALAQMRYGQLVLSESRSEPHDLAAASRILAKQGLGLDLESWKTGGSKLTLHDALQALGRIATPEHPEQIEAWAARVELLKKLHPELPSIDSSRLVAIVEKLLGSYSALEQLRGLDWEDALSQALEESAPGLSQELRQHTPTQFQLPNGRQVRIHYSLATPPWIESRLQDFFGTRTPPSILRGQLPLTLHLLAPNQRAVQVTTDLPGFWKKTYPELRGELSRRYPRHSWPEDPSKAEAADSKIKPRR